VLDPRDEGIDVVAREVGLADAVDDHAVALFLRHVTSPTASFPDLPTNPA
jgi:hypothetical protein